MKKYASCLSNIHVLENRQDVTYATFSRLEADFLCMKKLLEINNAWKYLINLCGQDFPIKSNREIVRELKLRNGTSSISSQEIKPHKKKWDRYAYSWYADREATKKIKHSYKVVNRPFAGKWYRSKGQNKMASYPPKKLSKTKFAKIYAGNAYNVFSRDFLSWSFTDELAQSIIKWSKDTFSPDEMVWGTLIRLNTAPGYSTNQTKSLNNIARKIMWARV